MQERLALACFPWLRVAVARRAAFHDIGDIDVRAPQADRLQQLIQELAGGPDEGLALAIFPILISFMDVMLVWAVCGLIGGAITGWLISRLVHHPQCAVDKVLKYQVGRGAGE